MERVDLAREFGKQPVRRWRNAPSGSSRCRFIAVGQLADGRWYAHHTGIATEAFVTDDEEQAQRLAEARLTDGQDWVSMPASLGPQGTPTDGGSWVRRGAEWFPAK